MDTVIPIRSLPLSISVDMEAQMENGCWILHQDECGVICFVFLSFFFSFLRASPAYKRRSEICLMGIDTVTKEAIKS